MTAHGGIIQVVVDHEHAETKGWRRALIDYVESVDGEKPYVARRLPDAYRIDTENDLVTVWEVEVTCVLSPERLEEWVMLWAQLDACDIELQLIRVDSRGLGMPYPLSSAYASILYERQVAA